MPPWLKGFSGKVNSPFHSFMIYSTVLTLPPPLCVAKLNQAFIDHHHFRPFFNVLFAFAAIIAFENIKPIIPDGGYYKAVKLLKHPCLV